jgi:hypothetical protein
MSPTEQKHKAAVRLLMAALHYDSFSKDPSPPDLSIIPQSPNLELIHHFLKQEADPSYKTQDALKPYGNITGADSV